MAKKAEQKDIILNIITKLKSDKTRDINSAVKKINKEFGSWNVFMKSLNERQITLLDKEHKHLKFLRAKAKLAAQIAKEREKEHKLARLQGARLGYNLSLLFFSWSVSRKINNVLGGWFKNYQKVTQGQTEFSNAVNQASAALSYLGFVIVDTFSRTDFVRKFVQLFVQLVNATAEFVSAHPKIAVSLVVGGMTISAIATLAQWVAQISLFVDALNKLKSMKAISKTASFVIDLVTPETWKDAIDYFTGKKSFKKLNLSAKLGVTITEIVIAAEIMKLISPWIEKLGAKLQEKFSEVFGRAVSRKIAIIAGEFVYDLWTALGPVGKSLYKWFFGESIDNLKKNIETLKIEEKIEEIKKKTGDLTISQDELNRVIEQSKVKSFWEDVANVMDKVIDKYDELLRKQAQMQKDLGMSVSNEYSVYLA